MTTKVAVHQPIKGKDDWYNTSTVSFDDLDEDTKEIAMHGGVQFSRSVSPHLANVCVVCKAPATTTGMIGMPEPHVEGYHPRFVSHAWVFETCDKCHELPIKDKKMAIFGRRHPFSSDLIHYINKKKAEGTAMGGERCSQFCLICAESCEKTAVQTINRKDGTEMQIFFGMCQRCSQYPDLSDLLVSQFNFGWGMRGSKNRLLTLEANTEEEMKRMLIAPNAELLLQEDEEPEEEAASTAA